MPVTPNTDKIVRKIKSLQLICNPISQAPHPDQVLRRGEEKKAARGGLTYGAGEGREGERTER